jgi:hypothetical protein
MGDKWPSNKPVYANDDRFVAMDREGDPPARDEVIVPGSWLRFVDAVESIAVDFKRYVDNTAAFSATSMEMLRAQTEATQDMRDEIAKGI